MAKGTYIESERIESESTRHLGGVALYVYLIFLLKRRFEKVATKKGGPKKNHCVNGDSLSFTYIEAIKKHGIPKSTFSRALDELLAKGFITCVYQGGTCKHDKSVFGLSDNYLHWKPGMVFQTRNLDPVSRGYRKPKTPLQNAKSKILALKNGPIHTLKNGP
jgi:hypothetical protein